MVKEPGRVEGDTRVMEGKGWRRWRGDSNGMDGVAQGTEEESGMGMHRIQLGKGAVVESGRG